MDSVRTLRYCWETDGHGRVVDFVYVEGTNRQPYSFGEGAASRSLEVAAFFIGTVTVTQALWCHVMGSKSNPAAHRGDDLPLENASWDEIHQPDGFLDGVNRSQLYAEVQAQLPGVGGAFRLPTEAEWEYAARGGSRWRDGFRFSGSQDVDAVAWYDRKHGDHTQPVARKLPNQLGIYDMSGNVWEWCQDAFTPDVSSIPENGDPFVGPAVERVLRGGCFHNWAIHCTVSKRYEIGRMYHDGCIGFRLVFSTGAPMSESALSG